MSTQRDDIPWLTWKPEYMVGAKRAGSASRLLSVMPARGAGMRTAAIPPLDWSDPAMVGILVNRIDREFAPFMLPAHLTQRNVIRSIHWSDTPELTDGKHPVRIVLRGLLIQVGGPDLVSALLSTYALLYDNIWQTLKPHCLHPAYTVVPEYARGWGERLSIFVRDKQGNLAAELQFGFGRARPLLYAHVPFRNSFKLLTDKQGAGVPFESTQQLDEMRNKRGLGALWLPEPPKAESYWYGWSDDVANFDAMSGMALPKPDEST